MNEHLGYLAWQAWDKAKELCDEISQGVPQEDIYAIQKEIDDAVAILALAKLGLDNQKH